MLFEEGSETKEEIIAAIEQNRRSDIAVEELRDQEIRTANELLPTATRESGGGVAERSLGCKPDDYHRSHHRRNPEG